MKVNMAQGRNAGDAGTSSVAPASEFLEGLPLQRSATRSGNWNDPNAPAEQALNVRNDRRDGLDDVDDLS